VRQSSAPSAAPTGLPVQRLPAPAKLERESRRKSRSAQAVGGDSPQQPVLPVKLMAAVGADSVVAYENLNLSHSPKGRRRPAAQLPPQL